MDFELEFTPQRPEERKLSDLQEIDKQLSLLRKPPETPITTLRKMLITHLEVEFWNTGKYPSINELQQEFPNSSTNEIVTILDLPDFSESLNNRGLPNYTIAGIYKFDPDAILAANLILDVADKRSTAAKLKALSLTTRHWRAFLRNPDFKQWFQNQVNSLFTEEVSTRAKISIATLVEANDLNAIKYFHQYTGEFTEKPQVIVENGDSQNLMLIIAKLMEVMARHVDPDLLVTVADEMEGVINPSNRIIETTGQSLSNEAALPVEDLPDAAAS